MALIQTNVGSINGKLADCVYYSSRWGNVVRENFTPYNPSSPKQVTVRTGFLNASNLWGTLTTNQKAEWELHFGRRSYQKFIGINFNREKLGLPMLTNPVEFPKYKNLKSLVPGVSTVAKLDINWQFYDGILSSDARTYLYISATQPKAAHARCPDPWYRVVATIPPLTAPPFDIMPGYLANWNPVVPIVGMRIMVQCFVVDGPSGNQLTPVYTSALTT